MPHIGFLGLTFGVWKGSVSHLYLAVLELDRVYEIWGSGVSPAVLAGAVRSTEHLGSYIPEIDNQGRRFPSYLSRNTLVFEVDGGFSVGSPHRVKIKFQSLRGSQPVLYEWDGRISLISAAPGGFKVDGTISRRSYEERYHFSDIMGCHDDWGIDSLQRLAIEQEAALQRRR